MSRLLATVILAFAFFPLPTARAQPQANAQSTKPEAHLIKVSQEGASYVKPDLGILVMSIQSSSPIAEEAVAANAEKAKAVDSALAGLGFASNGYKIGSVEFGHGGG